MNEEMHDVVILGAGPAGLQAAIHAARRKVSVLVLGREQKSSAYRVHIENYCCISGVMGSDLLREGRRKAEESGADFLDEDVTSVSQEKGHFLLKAESGKDLRTRTIVLAMGISRRKLGLKGEKELVGRGISYCVDCDAGFYREQPVAMIGCESGAVTGALTLLFFASEVHLVCEDLDVGRVLAEELKKSAIHLHEGRKPTAILGDKEVEGITLDDGTALKVNGVFIELGAKGAIELAGVLGIRLDESMKYIATSKRQETNIPGIYAAGDICGPPWQIAKAVGEGCVAGLEAAAYAKERKREGS